MKKNIIVILLCTLAGLAAQEKNVPDEIRLLVRGDDIGFSHAANVACIETFQTGIVRSVELMVPTPWFPEAMRLLKENPGLDVGIHLTLTSEWTNLKWRPLTPVKSLVDSNGYFFPMVWPNPNYPGQSIQEAGWNLAEIEQELRAQIELARKLVPQVSHLTDHMAFTRLDPALRQVVEKLAAKYGLPVDFYDDAIQPFPGWKGAQTLPQRIDIFTENLLQLQPGTWIFVDHPAKDTPEMQAIFHIGYENVATDRDQVTRVLTSQKVLDAVRKKNIRLISYKDLLLK